MKKLIDDLRAIQSEHIQVENIKHKLATFRAELDRKIILREQLMGRTEASSSSIRIFRALIAPCSEQNDS